jgi:hypothetical protein
MDRGETIPLCQICRHGLRIREAWRCFRRRTDFAYPFITVLGQADEWPVRWICAACKREADQRREETP